TDSVTSEAPGIGAPFAALRSNAFRANSKSETLFLACVSFSQPSTDCTPRLVGTCAGVYWRRCAFPQSNHGRAPKTCRRPDAPGLGISGGFQRCRRPTRSEERRVGK